jgi:hypothetical protein
MDFSIVKSAVATQFDKMQKHTLFRVNVDKDILWRTYLESFPPGTNPVLKIRTEHDCNCCKQFIRAVGDVVAIIDNKVTSIWDVKAGEYQAVVNAMSKLVKSHDITDIFLHDKNTAGTDKNFQDILTEIRT